MRVRLAIPALALLAGCSDHRILLVSSSPWTSAIVAVDGALTAYEGGGPIRFESPSPDVEVIAVLYAVPLADLDLVAGPIELAGRETRPLPEPHLSALALRVAGDDVASTELLPEGDPRLAGLRLPDIEATYCESRGRCLEITQARSCAPSCDPPAEPALPTVLPPAAPALPVPPEPAVIACPATWDPLTCRPPLPRAPATQPCPVDGWPTGVPSDHPVRWIDPDGGLGPSGEFTYGTIADALRGAPDDVVLALAARRHAGMFDLVGTQALIGACASATFVDGGTIRGAARISDVSTSRLVEVAPGAALVLTRVVLDGEGARIGGSLQASDIVFSGAGRAIEAQRRSQVEIVRMLAEARGPELMVSDGAMIDVQDLRVASATTGAIVAIGDGTITLHDSELLGTELHARTGGRLVLTDVAFGPDPRRSSPFDGVVMDGAALEASRVSFDRALRVAVLAKNARATLADVWIRDVASASRAALFDISRGSTLALDRASLTGFGGVGVWLDSGAVGRISHARLRAKHVEEIGAGLAGVRVETSAKLVMDHAEMDGIRGVGLEVRATGTATASDLTITGTTTFTFDSRSVEAGKNASLVLHRARIDDVSSVAVRTVLGARSVLSDIDVSEHDYVRAEGIMAIVGAVTTVDRVRVRGDVHYAFGIAEGSIGTARDVTLIAGGGTLLGGSMIYIYQADADVARVRIEGTPNAFVSLFDSRAIVSDVTVVADQEVGNTMRYPAIDMLRSEVTLSRVRLQKCNGPAVWANEGTATIEDIEVDGSGGPTDASRDHSININGAAQVTLRRLFSHDVIGAMLSAFNAGTRLEATDVLGQRTEDAGGRADQGATLVLERARFEDTIGNGVWASKGGHLVAKDLRVSRVERGRLGQGFGLAVASGSTAELERFAIIDARDSGVRVNLDIGGQAATLITLIDGLISGSRAGISVTDAMATVELTRVRLLNNAITRE